MMRKIIAYLVGLPALVGLLALPAVGQDFQQKYSLGDQGKISIKNVSGDITVIGYKGTQVVVNAYKEGKDRDLVEVEDNSAQGLVSLQARYPQNCNCEASIRFEVQVPQSFSYRFDSLATASGDIEVREVMGDIRIRSASGDLSVSKTMGYVDASTASGNVQVLGIYGAATAKSASGDVDVEIAKLDGEGELTFTSASGDVSVRLPGGFNADVEMSTFSGRVHSDFPLTVEDMERGHGQKAYGRLGNGGRRLKVTSASGSVRLMQF